MTEHTVKSFGEQLEALSALVAQMGGLAEAQFAAAIEAIARRDSGAAERAVGGDTRIDEVQQEIEDRALKLLALRQPGRHGTKQNESYVSKQHDRVNGRRIL